MLQSVDSLGNCMFRKPAHLGNPRVEHFDLFLEGVREMHYHRALGHGRAATSANEPLPMHG